MGETLSERSSRVEEPQLLPLSGGKLTWSRGPLKVEDGVVRRSSGLVSGIKFRLANLI